MSILREIPCNEALKEIGVFNYVKVVYIPLGVTVNVSFVVTPTVNELFPLSNYAKDLDAEGNFRKARRCFLHIDGASAEKIQVICSNVTPDGGYIDLGLAETLALEATTKTAIETLYANLAKEINPYQPPVITNGSSNSTVLTTILSKTLSCNKLKVNLSHLQKDVNGLTQGMIAIYINSKLKGFAGGYYDTGRAITLSFNDTIAVESGDLLEIKNISNSTLFYGYYSLEEYTLKP